MLRRTHCSIVFALTLVAGISCTTDPSTSVTATVSADSLNETSGTLLQCPDSTSGSATGVIGALGGTLSVGGTSVVIPADAVLSPTSFTLSVPASPYMEIEVTAGGSNHYVFGKPVIVTIDYGRCGGGGLLSPPHQVWNIDPVTKALIEKMAGVDIQIAHTVVFTTIHFSGYAVAD
jgi:hypothetical protein